MWSSSTQHSALTFFHFLIAFCLALLLSVSAKAQNAVETPVGWKWFANLAIAADPNWPSSGGTGKVSAIRFFNNPTAACKGFIDSANLQPNFGVVYTLLGVGVDPLSPYYPAKCSTLAQNTSAGDKSYMVDIPSACFSQNGDLLKDGPCENISISLTPAPYQNEPRPKGIEGKDGKSTFDLIAKVTENGSPKAGVAVTFVSKVEAKSGGHDHHDASRPKGDVPASGETDTNGEIKITFQATLFAGRHTVEATCNSCSNKTATHTLDVKVLNLTQLTGGGSGTLYKLVGDTKEHSSNHWFSYKAKDALIDLLSIFKRYGWGVVGVNDSSLMWGGCFDVPGRWGECKKNHAGHRTGEEVDLSFYRPTGVKENLRKKIYDDLKDSHKIEMPTILWHLEDQPNPKDPNKPLSYAHFHVYLLGQKQFGESKY